MKFVKFFAFFLAFLCSLAFLSFMIFLVFGFSFFPSTNLEKRYDLIHSISVDVSSSKLEIKQGDYFGIHIRGSNMIQVNHQRGELEIEEKKGFFFSKGGPSTITIFVQDHAILEDLDISFDAGQVQISNITAASFSIEQGAGTLTISDSKFNEADIEGGAGKISITKSLLNNLDLESGAGHVSIDSVLTGHSKIECGVGMISLHLIGNKSDYRFLVENGIGNIEIDGEKISTSMFGEGRHLLELKGGICNMKVDFRKE